MDKYIQRFRLPDKKHINLKGNVRAMEKKDVSAVLKLFNEQ
jgi:hypothetical protein